MNAVEGTCCMNASDIKLPVAFGISAGLIVTAITMACAFGAASSFPSGLSRHLKEMLKNKREKGYYLVSSVPG